MSSKSSDCVLKSPYTKNKYICIAIDIDDGRLMKTHSNFENKKRRMNGDFWLSSVVFINAV